MILTLTVLLIRLAWWLLVAWLRLFRAVGLVVVAGVRQARTRRAIRRGPPPMSGEWWYAAGGALAALAQVANPAEAARAIREVNPQPEIVLALHHLANAEGVSVDLAAWALAVADTLVRPAPVEVPW